MNWFQTLEADMKAWAMKALNVVEGDLESAGKQEATIVATAVAKVGPTLATTAVQDLVSGKPSQIAAGTAALLTATAQEVEAQTETVAADTLLEGVQQGVNSIVAGANAVKTAAQPASESAQ